MEFIDLNAQLSTMRVAIDQRIAKVLDHGQFIMGPEVTELEEKLADYVNVKHCITCANGTDALQIALMCQGIGSGDIVFTTSFSFFSTAEVIALVGATPVFVDIDPQTFNICPKDLERAIHYVQEHKLGNPSAVIAVDLFGLPANYSLIEPLCKHHQLLLIEDAAQGFGGSINGKRACAFGDIATTSFFPAKPLGCFGDGGALFTNSDEYSEIIKSIRVHGKGNHKYENIRIGLNSRLDTIQAAILLEKLTHFPHELSQRERVRELYDQVAGKWNKPMIPSGYASSWAQYTITASADSRNKVREYLHQHGIPTGIYYPIPLNQQTAFSSAQQRSTPIAEKIAQQVFSLPMSGYVSELDAVDIVNLLNNYSG